METRRNTLQRTDDVLKLRQTIMFTNHSGFFVRNNNAEKWNMGIMLSSEDKILIKTCGNLKDFCPKTQQ